MRDPRWGRIEETWGEDPHLCAEMGVKLTTVGATWPYGEDPRDTNIRIAPSYPTVEELSAALDVLVLAVKLVSAELAAEALE